jgi:hypothetical protein
MAERGKAKYAYLSSGSNNVVVQAPGTLYGVYGSLAAGGLVRIDDSHSFPQGSLNLNTAGGSNTILHTDETGNLFPGIGFNAGLVVAFTSNTTGITVAYE